MGGLICLPGDEPICQKEAYACESPAPLLCWSSPPSRCTPSGLCLAEELQGTRRPEKPTPAAGLQAANTGVITAPPDPYAQYGASALGVLSAAQMIALAYEYAWNEDYDNERAWLAAAAGASNDPAAAIAQVLLARRHEAPR